jgi:Arc/MetJ-type ribon-helix-helix transcriptional regulator
MTIHLPKDVETSIEAAVHGGHFASADDAVVAAWRVFEQTKLGKEPAGKKAKRTKPTPPEKKPITESEFLQHLMDIGLMTQLPDTAADFDDPDDQPITIEGEPLSETIIRERR